MDESTDPLDIGDPSSTNARGAVRSIGRYTLRYLLGRGAEASVYEAVDPVLARRVALKVYDGDDKIRTGRLLTGARLAGQLTHPNIVATYDFVHGKHTCAIVQELLEGDSLDRALPTSVFPVVSALTSIARAMVHAHERGIVHRDLKLDNVFACSSGALKVLDFGLAKDISELSVATIPVTDPNRVGTPLYMAPEVYEGASPIRSVDVWSFGVLAFRMVHGYFPFHGTSLLDLMNTVFAGVTPNPNTLPIPDGWPDSVFKRVAALIEHCLRRQPRERPPFSSILEDLDTIAEYARETVKR